MGYTILENKNMSESLKKKPRWMLFLMFTAGFIAITLSTVILGIFFGYTYRYVTENRVLLSSVLMNLTQILQTASMPYSDSVGANMNESDDAFISSDLVSRIFRMGQAIIDDDHRAK